MVGCVPICHCQTPLCLVRVMDEKNKHKKNTNQNKTNTPQPWIKNIE